MFTVALNKSLFPGSLSALPYIGEEVGEVDQGKPQPLATLIMETSWHSLAGCCSKSFLPELWPKLLLLL